MFTVLQAVALVAATLSTGFMASLFITYSAVIMPGLRGADDRTFIAGFQRLDAALVTPAFLFLGFLGALIFTGLAGLLLLGSEQRPALPWTVAALVLYLATFVITVAVHLPLNKGLKEAGHPDRIGDLAAVRAAFRETTWLAWNHVRSVVGLIAFGCLGWALVEFGRSLG
jgi:uncharacterized membrane protein